VETTDVVTAKVAVVVPPATVTVVGTVAAAGAELDMDTAAPPAGAGPESVTVTEPGVPPTSVVTGRASEARPAP
jgi:hypothetical protein